MARPPIKTAPDFGYALRTAREEQGLTQVDLAKRADVSVRWLSNFERGKSPRAELIKVMHVARALGFVFQLTENDGDAVQFADGVPSSIHGIGLLPIGLTRINRMAAENALKSLGGSRGVDILKNVSLPSVADLGISSVYQGALSDATRNMASSMSAISKRSRTDAPTTGETDSGSPDDEPELNDEA